MESLYILIPMSIVLVAIALGVFFWATNNGQFEDLDTPAWRILRDDEPVKRVTGDSGTHARKGETHD